MTGYWAKAPRSAKGREILQNREHARALFNAIKAMPADADSRVVGVAGLRFRSDAPTTAKAANDG